MNRCAATTSLSVSGVGPLFPLKKARLIGLLFWSFAVSLQAVLWASVDNLAAGAMTLVGGVAGSMYALRRHLLRSMPISTVMVFGYTAYYFLLPPVATLIELKALSNNLNHPVLVEVHALIGLLTLITAHLAYRAARPLQELRRAIVDRLYRPIGYFAPASNVQLLIMGLLGLVAMAYQALVAGAAQQDALGAGNKMMQAMYPLAYLPFCILLKGITRADGKINTRWLLLLAGYMALLVAVSLTRNSRAAFLLGVMSIVMCYGYGLVAGLVSKQLVKPKYLVPAALAAAVLIGPVADLATSMVIVRGQRSDISPMELMQETISAFGNKQAISDRRLADQDVQHDWDERYTDNLFLARLANLKFTDNSVDLALRMDGSARDFVRNLEFQRALAIFPRPVLNVVAPWVDKDFVSASSGGDLMLYAVSNNRYVLGGFRTGSLVVSAYAVFGWLYPIFLGLAMLLVFALADTQSMTVKRDGQWLPVIAPMAAATFFTWFYYLTSAATGVESVSALFTFLLRGWVQVLVVYAFAYWIARFASRIRIL